MHKYKHKLLLALPLACILGCAKEYEPQPESIPDIPPGRSSARADGDAFAAKTTTGKKAAGPGNALAKPK
ncbi:MAG: hypothetical protein NTY15_09160 [Planctomycetota bacterium]|nr:hypothetical protein [Planctomycetota bacterium]